MKANKLLFTGLMFFNSMSFVIAGAANASQSNFIHLLILNKGDYPGSQFESLGFPKGTKVLTVSYHVKEHSATKSGSYRGVRLIHKANSPVTEINIKVDRKNSTAVADVFQQWGAGWSHNYYYENPGKLNFAIQGTLEFKVKYPDGSTEVFSFPDFVIAQGHKVLANNWWAGGKYCEHAYFPRDIDSMHCLNFFNGGKKEKIINEMGFASAALTAYTLEFPQLDHVIAIYPIDHSENYSLAECQ